MPGASSCGPTCREGRTARGAANKSSEREVGMVSRVGDDWLRLGGQESLHPVEGVARDQWRKVSSCGVDVEARNDELARVDRVSQHGVESLGAQLSALGRAEPECCDPLKDLGPCLVA